MSPEVSKQIQEKYDAGLLSKSMMEEINKDSDKAALYLLDGKPKFRLAYPVALQHLLVMFTSNLTPVLLIGAAAQATTEQIILMVQCAMFMAGCTTFINLYPIKICKNFQIGANLPIVMGTSSTFIAPASVVAASAVAMGYENPIGVVIGAMLIGSLAEGVIGVFYKQLKNVFPPLVIGSIILSIGFGLVTIGVGNLAGGTGNASREVGDILRYGSPQNLLLGFGVFFGNVFLQRFGKGMWKITSILLATVGGYLAALAMGMIDLSAVGTAGWIAIPMPFELRPQFEWWAISSMLVLFAVSGLSTIGYTNSITNGGLGREATVTEIRGAIFADTISSTIACMFNSTPNTEFGQNAGIVIMTKIINKWVIVLTACTLIVAGLFPKFGAVFAATPPAVLGGAVLAVFAMILTNGMMMIAQDGFSPRNIIVLGITLGIGIGFGFIPTLNGAIEGMPGWLQVLFRDRIALISSVAVLANLFFPKDEMKTPAKAG